MPIIINHDGSVDIATGRSRKETNWKNKETQWSELVQKLSITHRTAESYSEYVTAKKVRQDEIKDIGGFVGGYLSGGRRKSGSVLHRQLITLDIDFAQAGLWDDFTMLYNNAAVLYSTHKHSAENNRFRLILPLDRLVSPEEYMAIARGIAGTLGINNFDHTTFQPERLMYYPSTSKDGVFVFQYQDGEWLSADGVLRLYRNWKDSSEWPVSSREGHVINKAIQKQGDPLEKPGIVGAFCRTYNIHEAIDTFLTDVYDACDVDNRYSYKEGSTAAGLVVYDDKYAYSHHGTDPVSGKLCNAFDLVRIHKFGLKDEDAREGTVSVKLPSYLAMLDFANADPKCKRLIVSEKLQSVKDDFSEVSDTLEDEPEDDNEDWQTLMDTDRKGNFLSTINNIFTFIENDKRLKGRIAFDEFENRLIAVKNLPWRKVTANTQDFTDDDDECLAHYLESKKIPFTYVQKALAKIRIEHKFHPVRDYLDSLKWDGAKRIDSLFIDYFGAEDNDYTRTVTRKWLIAGARRIYQPGCQFDNAPILVGKQGIGKSTIISKLGRKWFSNNLGDVHTKEAMENLRGIWIMEMGEMAKLKNADAEAVKNFISTREDIYRPAYGRRLAHFLRQCIFIGSTNVYDFLRDATGNRRFWPIITGLFPASKNVFEDLTEQEVDQVWAEAVYYHSRGESLDLPDSVRTVAEAVQEAHTADSGQKGIIYEYLEKLLPEDWEDMNLSQRRGYLHYDDELEKVGILKRDIVCAAEIWCELFKKEKGDMNAFNTKEIHDVMRNLKSWTPTKATRKFPIYGYQRGYVRMSTLNATNGKQIQSVFSEN